MNQNRPPFRADHVGSLLRSREVIDARNKHLAGSLSADKLAEIEDAAIRDAIAMQERVGLQAITDGEIRRNDWRDRFFERVDGFSSGRIDSSFEFTEEGGARRKGRPIPTVVGKLRRRATLTADDFAFLHKHTKRTAKATLPSPTVNHFFSGDHGLKGSPYRDRQSFFSDVAAIYKDEVRDLHRSGCRYLQIDEVPLAVLCDPKNQDRVRKRGEDPAQLIDEYIALINTVVRDRPTDMTVCVHMCRGNSGQGQASGGYEVIAETAFRQLDVDGFFLEFDTERAGGFEPLQHVTGKKVAVLGLMSTKVATLESKDVLKRRVEEATTYIDLDRLAISPQCGFASSFQVDRFTFSDEERKLAFLVQVADEIWT
jgi:5-methyltetrahydropteroyltriglutamate--homocysteine methyltransferase